MVQVGNSTSQLGRKRPHFLRMIAEAFKISVAWKTLERGFERSKSTMQLNNTDQKLEIRFYILEYLAENPDAGDTFTGIVDQWLLRQRIAYETRNVSEVVAQLESDGLIFRQTIADSETIYRVNRTRENAIRKMLSEMKPAGHSTSS